MSRVSCMGSGPETVDSSMSLVPCVTSGPKTVNSSMIPVPYMRSRPKTVGSSVPETVISSMSQTPPEGEVYQVRKI